MHSMTPYHCHSNTCRHSFTDLMELPARAPSLQKDVSFFKSKLRRCGKLSEQLEHLTTQILSAQPDARTHKEKQLQWLQLGKCLETATTMRGDLIAQSNYFQTRLIGLVDTEASLHLTTSSPELPYASRDFIALEV